MTDKILEVRGLTKTYGGEKKPGAKQPTPTLDVLKGIDIDIYRGDVVCLIGPSGCGKSTFLRCLNRLEIPTSGSIKFEGVEVDDAHIDAVRQKMGMVFQPVSYTHLDVYKRQAHRWYRDSYYILLYWVCPYSTIPRRSAAASGGELKR